jgi:hypothetical protein
MTLRQLRRVASTYGISRYSRMRKAQLLTSIQEIENNRALAGPSRRLEQAQEEVEAAKFNLGQDINLGQPSLNPALNSVDEGLAELPEGYGESRIILIPRDPLWSYVYWDIANEHKEELRAQGGQQLGLRVYDVTQINLGTQHPHNVQEYPCEELARDWYLPIPVSDRDYLVEIGYRCADGRWLVLAQSTTVHVPPIHPSDWVEEHFIEVNWQEDLPEENICTLTPPLDLLDLSSDWLRGGAVPAPRYVSGSNQQWSKDWHTPGSVQSIPGSIPLMVDLLDRGFVIDPSLAPPLALLSKTSGWDLNSPSSTLGQSTYLEEQLV